MPSTTRTPQAAAAAAATARMEERTSLAAVEGVELKRAARMAQKELEAARAATAEAAAMVSAARAENTFLSNPETSAVSSGGEQPFHYVPSDLVSAISAVTTTEGKPKVFREAATDLQLRVAASISSQKAGTLEKGSAVVVLEEVKTRVAGAHSVAQLQVRACVGLDNGPTLGWCTAFKDGHHNLVELRPKSGTSPRNQAMRRDSREDQYTSPDASQTGGDDDSICETDTMASRIAKKRLERRMVSSRARERRAQTPSLGEAVVAKLGSKYDHQGME